jgi:hypothetical protein
MPVTVRIQDEFGAPLDDGWDDVHSSQALVAPDATGHCLPFIDPYGDTLFNQLQIPDLIGELMEHRAKTRNEPLTRTLDSLISYLQNAEERVHVYVRFIGD